MSHEDKLTKLRSRVEKAKKEELEYTVRYETEVKHLKEDYGISIKDTADIERQKEKLQTEIDTKTTRLNVLLQKADDLITKAEDRTNAK